MVKLNIQQFADVTTDAESNLITQSQMAKVREVDFVRQFVGNILRKLEEALGVTRKIPMEEGTTMYYYTSTGTLQDGNVPEGEIIPLSQMARNKTAVGEITLKKWRKAASAESIKKSGYNEAVNETDKHLVNLVQKGIRSDFFTHLNAIDGAVVAESTFQAVLAGCWGKLQVLFEDEQIESVYFVNPLTIADYLKTATVTVQNAFGMKYIEDFLGLGTVIMSTGIPKDHVVATAKNNLIEYYITMNGDIARAFNLTADETGFIGIKSGYANNERAQIESLVMSGIQFMVEYAAGVVHGQIDSTPTLQSVTVTSDKTGASSGQSHISTSVYSLGTGEKFVYKCAASTAPAVTYGQKLTTGWTDLPANGIITPGANMTKITVAAVDSLARAQAAGSQTLAIED